MSEMKAIEISEASALNMLNYCITMATLKKINYNFKIDLPYETLAEGVGVSKKDAAKYFGTALRVMVKLEWVEDSEEMEYSHD